MSTPHDSGENVADDLLDQIEHGDSAQQQAAVDRLNERAERSNDPDEWNVAAIGLHRARRFDEEIEVLTQLVRKFPAKDVYRLNLATAYSQIESIDLCRFHLKYLVEHGSTDEMRRIGEEQLDGYETFVGLTESDTRLRRLQVGFLKERVTRDSGTASNYIRLAKVFMRMGKLEPGGGWSTRAAEVLETGLATSADRREILELLAYCYLQSDPDHRLNVIAKQLEQVAPESSILESLADLFRLGGGPAAEALAGRAQMLLQQVQQPDESLREAVLRDLARIVDTHPDSSSYRLTYAFALGTSGRTEEALGQAERLAELPNQEHSFHFNLGQIFWWSDDPVRGRRHLELAIRYAANEQEEQDARDRIAELEATE